MTFVLLYFSGSSKQEEACELYVRAGNAFKMAKKWPRKYCYPPRHYNEKEEIFFSSISTSMTDIIDCVVTAI